MCFKSCKNTSFLLNPSAQEWRPSAQSHVIFTPSSQPAAPPPPPQTAVQVVAFAAAPPPQKLAWQLASPFYFQGFIHYGQCIRPLRPLYHFIPFSFPATGDFYEAAPPAFGGCEKKYVGGAEVTMLESGMNKVEKPMMKSRISSVRCYSVNDQKAPTRRQEWMPRKLGSDNEVAGGCTTPSPPCNSAPKQLSASRAREELSSSKTTVMIRNIPNQLRRDFMLEFLDRYCNEYSLEYDFLYLPMDFSKEDNLGYAFVNFTTTGAALKFKKILQNYKWGTLKTERGIVTSKKICQITWATIQGKEGQVNRFRDSIFACDELDFLPVVLDPPRNGSNTELAPPVVVGKLRQESKSF